MTSGQGRTAIVVMGMAGCGKTSIAHELAEQLRWAAAEADAFHPPQNVAKMSAGLPLTDEDPPGEVFVVEGVVAKAGEDADVAVSEGAEGLVVAGAAGALLVGIGAGAGRGPGTGTGPAGTVLRSWWPAARFSV